MTKKSTVCTFELLMKEITAVMVFRMETNFEYALNLIIWCGSKQM